MIGLSVKIKTELVAVFTLSFLPFELVLGNPKCEVYRYRYYLNNAGSKNKT